MLKLTMKIIKNTLFCFLAIFFLVISFFSCGNKNPPEKVQIILLSVDTLRGDHLNSYGYVRETAPNLAKLIDDSVYYKNAYTNGCWTMPSHMSLLTGTLPSRHNINQDWKSLVNKKYHSLNKSVKLISELIKKKKVHTIKYAQLPGELGFSKGFDKDYQIDPFFNDSKFNKLVNKIKGLKNKDFFLFLHTWMVHAPYSNSSLYYNKKLMLKRKIISIISGKKLKAD